MRIPTKKLLTHKFGKNILNLEAKLKVGFKNQVECPTIPQVNDLCYFITGIQKHIAFARFALMTFPFLQTDFLHIRLWSLPFITLYKLIDNTSFLF